MILFRHIFAPPTFADDENKTRIAALLHTIFLGTIGLAVILSLLILILQLIPLPYLIPISAWLLLALSGLFFLRRGYVTATGLVFTLFTWLFVTLFAVISGGIHAPVLASYMIVVLLAGLIYSARVGIVFVGLSVAAGIGLLYAELNGHLPPPLLPDDPLMRAVGLIVILAYTAMLVYLVTFSISNALDRARRQEMKIQMALEALRLTLEAQQQGEANFRALADNANDGIIVLVGDSHIVYANQRAMEIIGYNGDELREKSIQKLIHPAEYEGMKDLYRQRLAGAPIPLPYELTLVHKMGHSISVEVTLARTTWEGQPAATAIFRDVTERKRMGQELDQYHHHLEELVAKRAADLARANEQLQQEVTQRKRAEEALQQMNEELERRVELRTRALRRSEQMFRDLAENIREVFWIRDQDRMLYISPAYEQIWGRSRASLYQNPNSLIETLASEDRKRVESALKAEFDQQRVFDQEYRIIRPDGTLHWVWARSFPVKKEDGSVYSVGIAEDITERKQIGEALKQSEKMFRNIVEAIPLGMHMYRLESGERLVFTGANPAADKILGVDHSQFIGKTIEEAFPGLIKMEVPEKYRLIATGGGTWQTEEIIYQEGQIAGVFEVRAFQTSSGQMVAAFLDISARRHIEKENVRLFQAEQERYREAEALRRAALTLTSTIDLGELLGRILRELQAVIPYDSATVQLLKKDHLEIIAGQGFADPPAVIGTCIPLQEGFSPDYQVISSLKPVIISDTTLGSPLTLAPVTPATTLIRSWVGVPLVFKNRAIGMITLDKHEPDFYNETHGRTAEAYAAQAAIALENARLYQDLQNQMLAFQGAQAQLMQSERMAALGRLMASIAHEINNPLQGILGFLSLLGEELKQQRRQEKIDHYLDIANREIERIAHIVHRMREFYRLPTSSMLVTADSSNGFYHISPAEIQAVDLHQILESVLQLANKKLQHSRVVVEQKWSENLPLIQASPDHLKQVFLNLTLNAVDAMQAQGGTLFICTAPYQMQSYDSSPQPAVQIEFRDTGAGIPPNVLARLFEPFISSKEYGTGLGLFTSYQIITAHHGQLTADSQPDQGTTFTILLPVEQPLV